MKPGLERMHDVQYNKVRKSTTTNTSNRGKKIHTTNTKDLALRSMFFLFPKEHNTAQHHPTNNGTK